MRVGPAARFASPTCAHRVSGLRIALHLACQRVEKRPGPVPTHVRILQPVEERAMLGQRQPRSLAVALELDRHQGNGDADLVDQQFVRVDDPLVWNDLPIDRAVAVYRALCGPTAIDLAPALPEVELVRSGLPLLGADEPAGLCGGGRPGGEHPLGRGAVAALY